MQVHYFDLSIYFLCHTSHWRLMGRLVMRLRSLAFQSGSLKPNRMRFHSYDNIFQYLRIYIPTLVFSIKLSIDIALSVLWGLTFYLVSSTVLLEAPNNEMTWLRSFPGLRQLNLSRPWEAFKMTFLQSHTVVVFPYFSFNQILNIRKYVK